MIVVTHLRNGCSKEDLTGGKSRRPSYRLIYSVLHLG